MYELIFCTPQLTVLDVDGLADSIVAAAAASAANPPKLSVPDLESYIWQTHHESIQVKFLSFSKFSSVHFDNPAMPHAQC